MLVIADSGSTKTDWALMEGKEVKQWQTVGMNPVHQSAEALAAALADVPVLPADAVVYFYGAGCAGAAAEKMSRVLRESLGLSQEGRAIVCSDLLAAARSLLGTTAGMACILGTGSNSCYYDGQKITSNIHPLGYVLGDEGSGASLGRMLLNAIYKNRVSADIKDCFELETGLNYDKIIERVYAKPAANRFLGSLTRFVAAHKDEDAVLHEMVVENFRQFINCNLRTYGTNKLNAVGSVAFYFHKELEDACKTEDFRLGKVLKSPMKGLIEYHSAETNKRL